MLCSKFVFGNVSGFRRPRPCPTRTHEIRHPASGRSRAGVRDFEQPAISQASREMKQAALDQIDGTLLADTEQRGDFPVAQSFGTQQ